MAAASHEKEAVAPAPGPAAKGELPACAKAALARLQSAASASPVSKRRCCGDKTPAAEEEKKEGSPEARTWNGAVSLATSGSALLDLFFSTMVRGAQEDKVHTALAAAWAEDPENAVRVLMQGRDCRGGKGERLVVHHGLLWLRLHKPRTYLLNLHRFVGLGYHKDLLQLALLAHQRQLPLIGAKELIELELLADELRTDFAKVDSQEAAAAAAAAAAAPEAVEAPAAAPRRVSLSLAAKWAPTEGCAFDRKAKLASRLAALLFPSRADALRLYRQRLSPMRDYLRVTERLMCDKRWDEIDFATVPSRAHKRLRRAFQRHEEERYAAYMARVKVGKAEIKSVGVHPHELVAHYLDGTDATDDTIEEQWKAQLRAVREAGALRGCVSVVDVSGSMSGTPMAAAIALGLFTALCTEGEFAGHVITFHSDPSWARVKGDTLREQVQNLQAMPWGCNTDLQKVFDLILLAAKNGSVRQQDMPQTLFIFSDMQFDMATGNTTNFEAAKRKFHNAGYAMPRVVFWNLSGAISDVPVSINEHGVALLSGFSPSLLKQVMFDKAIDPLKLLLAAISRYEVDIDEEERELL